MLSNIIDDAAASIILYWFDIIRVHVKYLIVSNSIRERWQKGNFMSRFDVHRDNNLVSSDI